MIKKIKARWQAWLDSTPYPVFAQEGEKPDPLASSALNRPNPYKELAASNGRLIARVPGTVPVALVVREYEDDLPQWAREALADMDRVVGMVIRDEVTEVRTPQYVRRHRRNLREAIEEVPWDLLNEDEDELAVSGAVDRIISNAKRASAPDVTGMIPVITDDAQEEAYV
jgi:hypothetical protein